MTLEEFESSKEQVYDLIDNHRFEEAENLLLKLVHTLDSQKEIVQLSDRIDREQSVLTIEEEAQISAYRADVLLILADTYRKSGKTDAAFETLHTILSWAELHSNIEIIAKVHRISGSLYSTIGSLNNALESYTNEFVIREQLGNELDIARSLGNLGSISIELGLYDKALEYFFRSYTIFEQIGNTPGIGHVTSNIGMAYSQLGLYDKSIEFSQKALDIHQRLGDQSYIATTLGNIGLIYFKIGAYDKALAYFVQGLDILTILDEKEFIAGMLHNIAGIFLSLSEYDSAMQYFRQALAIFEEFGQQQEIARVSGCIADLYLERNEYDKALEHYKQALAISEEIGDKRQAGYWLLGMAEVLKKTGNTDEAMDYSLRSLHVRRNELQTNEGVATSLLVIGSLYAQLNNPEEAIEKLQESLVHAKKYDQKNDRVQIHHELYFIYKKINATELALEHFEHYHNLEKEMQSEEAVKQAQLMEHRRKVEEAERDRQIKLARFQEQEKILHKTLPPAIADRLIAGEKDIADRYESVSILFADIVGFTPLSTRKTPREVVHILNNLFSRFDKLTEKYGVERIKTIGDAYMIVSGAPEVVEDHALRMAQTAFGMLDEIAAFNAESGENINLRIGVNSGEAIAAVVGNMKFAYDLWGDAVNTASRMESHGEAGKIHVSDEFVRALSSTPHETFESFHFQERGELNIKGKGKMKTYFLEH